MALTREQFQELRDKGLSVEQIVAFESGQAPQAQPQPQKGFLRSVIEDPIKTLVVKPGVRFGQAVGATVAGAVGVPQERIQQAISKDVNFPLFGGITVEGQKQIGEGGGKQILGDIAKSGSYLYTGGTGLGVKELLKTGAIGGATYSFGDAVQDAEATPASVAYQTMFGGVAGATTGLLFSGLLKGVSKALDIKSTLGGGSDINKVNAKINELNQEVFKPTKTQLERAGTHDIIKTYTDVFGVDVPQVDANNRFLKESTLEFVEKVDELYRPASQAFNTILRNSPEVVDLLEVKQQAISKINTSKLKSSLKELAVKKINKEYEAVYRRARNDGWLRGPKNLPVEFADNFKDEFWGATRSFGTEEASVTNAVNKQFGFAFKEAIEKAVPDVNVQNFNNKLGDLITLREFLEDIAGKQAGTGGKMTRLLAGRVAGTIAGSTGGIPGAIVGNLSGDLIAKIMIDPKMQPYRWLLRKRLAQLPRAEVTRLEQEANVVLQGMFERRMAKIGLPEPTPLGTSRNPIITPAPTTFEPQAQQIGQLRNQSQSASMNPTNTVNKNPIPKTLDQTTKKNNRQAGFISTGYKGEKDLTTKILKDLEGKTTVSKQYILDATNRGELKQVERDLIRQVLDTEKGDTINVSDFAKKVKAELLPLKRIDASGTSQFATENVVLPDEIRGNVKNYMDVNYTSPIKTSAGENHFNKGGNNYFGHTRIEDMADNKTRRVIEVQSDLYQKGNLEQELPHKIDYSYLDASKIKQKPNNGLFYVEDASGTPVKFAETKAQLIKDLSGEFDKKELKRIAEVKKLQQYNDPTAHFRMIREEIKKAAQDGKTKLQFPTGETATKIEGLGEVETFRNDAIGDILRKGQEKVGMQVTRANGSDEWIITDVLGDGKFKAVPKSNYDFAKSNPSFRGAGGMSDLSKMPADDYLERLKETFDISGKVDTNNPIYRFYEKDMQKYLNKFGGKRIVDDKGVSWIEVPIKKEWGNEAVEAFGMITNSPLFVVAGATGAVAGVRKLMSDKKK